MVYYQLASQVPSVITSHVWNNILLTEDLAWKRRFGF